VIDDDTLGALVARHVDGPSRRLAVAVVGPGWQATTFVDADGATRFETGSVTKLFTGLLLADAAERGELALARPIGEVLGALAGSAAGTVSSWELSTHTSGLPRLAKEWSRSRRSLSFVLRGSNPYAGIGREDLVAAAATARLEHRGSFCYSNFGAALAGAVLEEVSSLAFPELVAARLLDPLGMSASAIQSSGPLVEPGWSRRGRRVAPWVQEGTAPAGGLVSTLDDMRRLLRGLLAGTAAGTGALLGAPGPGPHFFAAVDVVPEGMRRVWHNGQTGGYSAVLAVWPDHGLGLVALRSVASALGMGRILTAVGSALAGADRLG
jgi:CubicO group peptidase (beta-lactamase class C family)